MLNKSVVRVIIATFIISLSSAQTVVAGPYIDPNTGGMLFQMLAVAFGLISGFVLLFYSQIKMLFARFLRFVREKRGIQPETTDQITDQATDQITDQQ